MTRQKRPKSRFHLPRGEIPPPPECRAAGPNSLKSRWRAFPQMRAIFAPAHAVLLLRSPGINVLQSARDA